MRHLGADIRKIALPVDRIAAGVRQTLSALGWRILDEQVDDGFQIIHAAGNLSGGLAFRVASGRQRVEWRLRKLSTGYTRLETRYGLDPRFRRRFWSALVLLALLSLLFYDSGESILMAMFAHASTETTVPFWAYAISLCISAGFLLACFALAISAIGGNVRFSRIIERLGMGLEREHGHVELKVLQSDYLFPDIFLLLLFSLIGFILFLILEWIRPGHGGLFHFPGFWSIFCLLGVLLALIVPSLLYRGFKERLSFIILAIAVLIPVLMVYGLPTINLWLPDRILTMSPTVASGAPAEAVHRLMRLYPEHINSLVFFLTAGNLAILLLAAIMAAGIPTLAEQLIRERTNYFLTAPRRSTYRRALEANDFSRVFVLFVLIFWLLVTAMLYWVLYTGMSVFEWGLWGRQVWFATQAGRVFFDTLHLIASAILVPMGVDNLAVPAARAMALIYGIPLVAIIAFLVARRWTAWRRKRKLLRGRSSTRSERGMQALASHCDHIAHENGLRRPLIVVDASPLPVLQCFFMGFPHFRSALVVSWGCLRLTDHEIEGLLAHELFHIQRHTLRWYLLGLLSDITFFGTGFLTVLTNSFDNERAADRFALEWLRKRHIPVADYTRALRIVSMAASARRMGGFSLMASALRESRQTEDLAPTPKGRWRLLIDLYFGDTVASYIHPPLESRIAAIEAMDACHHPSIQGPGKPAG
ncbi:hypothetical protein DSCO28_41710 [Desulfosarcina ovata subsp. sediminis]|uniref:Peptidase M48 domain-containing protein n=1 Tax=Desulfosarcina ovata subsp. sediminis TaxID=885957 RepID=A0A5K7ZTR5_9BACT|nr:M48 family metalloprotease [Desulfosarcina ovata]BBO83605.1 hypothetical protein DSCO28_41710 [Desulfosarcina ovata subsp. sediminis]